MATTSEPRARPSGAELVHPSLVRAAAWSWRLLVVAAAVAVLLWLLGQLLVVVVPMAVAVLATRALWPVAAYFRRRGLRAGLAAILTMAVAAVVVGGLVTVAAASMMTEFDELGPTITEGIDDAETWLVEDSPFEVSRADIERWRDEAGQRAASFVGQGGGTIAAGAVLAAEVVVGSLLATIVTFFLLRDGSRMAGRLQRSLPAEHHDRAARAGARAWAALGGFLRGALLLGVVEAVVIGIALLVVGADLVAAVMIITFLAAFVPILGAIVAGVVAVLVTLVTAGATQALVIAAVAIVVQQLDNDLLAPVIYGRALRLHPLAVLLAIVAGGALFGLVGTFLAVPVLAVVANVTDELRRDGSELEPRPAAGIG